MTTDPLAARVARLVRDVPDFPRAEVLFKDIAPLLADGPTLAAVVEDLAERYRGRIDVVAGVEARGFALAAPIAVALGVGFVPVRKAGKLPGHTHQVSYDLEYGSATVEVQQDAFQPGQRVLLVDDVLATGGTALAACSVLESAGATLVEVAVLLELAFLSGRAKLVDRQLHSVLVL